MDKAEVGMQMLASGPIRTPADAIQQNKSFFIPQAWPLGAQTMPNRRLQPEPLRVHSHSPGFGIVSKLV